MDGAAFASIDLIGAQLSLNGLLFGGLATLAIASALGVALSKNILYSGFSLMGTLVGVAGLYLFIGADFIGIAQLVIYIGGILVLILFAVLLTNRIGSVTVSNRSASRGVGAVAGLGIFLLTVLMAMKTQWATSRGGVRPRPPAAWATPSCASTCCPSSWCRSCCSWRWWAPW